MTRATRLASPKAPPNRNRILRPSSSVARPGLTSNHAPRAAVGDEGCGPLGEIICSGEWSPSAIGGDRQYFVLTVDGEESEREAGRLVDLGASSLGRSTFVDPDGMRVVLRHRP